MKEYVKDKQEFSLYTESRIHWLIEKEPVMISRMDGMTGTMHTGEYRLILSISGISCDELPTRTVFLKLDLGRHFPNQDSYKEAIEAAEAYIEKEFPDATEGAFE